MAGYLAQDIWDIAGPVLPDVQWRIISITKKAEAVKGKHKKKKIKKKWN